MGQRVGRQIPVIPGWAVRHPGADGVYIAERLEPLTPYQRQYGCLEELGAGDERELECLCIAQIVLAAMVERAEALMRSALEEAAESASAP